MLRYIQTMRKIHAVSFWMGARECPLCGSDDVVRSRRIGVLEWTLLLPLLIRPFRCRECSARHLTFFFRKRRKDETSIDFSEPLQD